MITVRLFGGLGNQMFQYAFARRLAIEHDTSVVLDLGWFKYESPATTSRRYELGVFALDEATPKRAHRPAGRRSRLPWRRAPSLPVVSEKHVTSEIGSSAPDDVWLNGYWQSEKYFVAAEEEVREAFRFKRRSKGHNAALLQAIRADNSVSLHVRRGDYVTDPRISKVHGASTLDYYRAAVEEITTRIESPRFYVFSDDPGWSRENIVTDHPTVYVSHNTGRSSFEDMRLMSHCRHHITANSSFSWWGAWLGQSADRIVIAPKVWFAEASKNTSDRVPEGWIRL